MVLEFYEAAQFTYTRPKDHLPSSSPCNSFAFFFSACLALFKLWERELLFCSIISNWLFSFIALRLRLLNELNGYNNLAIYWDETCFKAEWKLKYCRVKIIMLIQVYISKFRQYVIEEKIVHWQLQLNSSYQKRIKQRDKVESYQTKDLDKLSPVILLNCYFTQLSKIGCFSYDSRARARVTGWIAMEKKILLIQEILASYPFPTLEKLHSIMKIRKMFIFSYRVVSSLGLLLLLLLAPAP